MLLSVLMLTQSAEAGCTIDIATHPLSCREQSQTCYITLYSDDEWSLCAVDYSITGNNATAGSDFTAISGTATWFSDGHSRFTIQVPILQDDELELTESFDLTLTPTYNASLAGPAVHEISLLDDDAWIGLTWAEQCTDSSGDIVACSMLEWLARGNSESGTHVLMKVFLSGAMDFPIPVTLCPMQTYFSDLNNATETDDYDGSCITQTIAAGDTESIFAFPIYDDIAVEGNEGFGVDYADELPITAYADGECAVLNLTHHALLFIVDDEFGAE